MDRNTATLAPSQEIVDRFKAVNWETALPELIHYTLKRLARFRWRRLHSSSSQPFLPAGNEAKDLVQEAIVCVFEGTNAWDPATKPDPIAHLKDIISSKISNLAYSAENKTSLPPDQAAELLPSLPDSAPNPRDASRDNELQDRFLNLVLSEDDEPLLLSVADLLLKGVCKPQDIAENLACSVHEVNNAKRTLIRRAQKQGEERLS